MYLLEDLEEIEMADYEIESLDGIEACRYARVVDLTNNNLTDLTDLGHLHQVERLYLSNNHIGMIDSLSNLTVLQVWISPTMMWMIFHPFLNCPI